MAEFQGNADEKLRVLVVDSNTALARTTAESLSRAHYEAVAVDSSPEASHQLREQRVDALIVDLAMPKVDGLELFDVSKRADLTRPVIVTAAAEQANGVFEAIRRGAYYCLAKPYNLEELSLLLARALEESSLRREAATLRLEQRDKFTPASLVAESATMRRVLDLVERVAMNAMPVMITGEAGTGKSLVARTIHALSPRAHARFVQINCSALPESVLNVELFGNANGHEGAQRRGVFYELDGGTVFLDDVGGLPAAAQAKLLQIIERGSARPSAAGELPPADVRLLTATQRDLREAARSGAFREDLLYRLDVVRVEVPPLRERREDLPGLIEHFLREALARHPGSAVRRLSPAALGRLLRHAWPGNVRELMQVLERAVLLGGSSDISESELLSALGFEGTDSWFGEGEVMPMRELQKRYAQWAYQRVGGRKMLAAEKLGIDFKTLNKLLLAESTG